MFKNVVKEFKEFAVKGNVVDLAVGVIIGGAFGKIVTSLVNDIMMPPLGFLLGNVDFSDLAFVLKEAGEKTPAVTINYGTFINNIIGFLIVAFSVFLLVKVINRLKREEPKAPPVPTSKDCPECAMAIPIKAKKCPHCASAVAK